MKKGKENILLLDIETAPNIGYTWGLYEQDVIQVTQNWYILCCSWKWLNEKKVHAIAQIDSPAFKKDKTNDKNVILKLWELLDKADVVIAHNGAAFDLPKINTRFIEYGLKPPSPYKIVDTLKVAKKTFKFDSNKLDALGKDLNVGRKLSTGGFDLWLGCMAGDKKAWKKMVQYNKQDVALLEEVYLRLRPWMTNHPNLNIFNERLDHCPHCQSSHLQKRGHSITLTGRKPRYQCQSCGAWCHGKAERTGVLVS